MGDKGVSRVAVILAGGSGQRVGLGIPKQFVRIAGATVLEHTTSRFLHHPAIDEIVITMAAGYMDEAQAIVDKLAPLKPVSIVDGGETRQDSTVAAVNALQNRGECHLVVHDAVRPLLHPSVITRHLEALEHHDVVDTLIPTADTIAQVNPAGDRVVAIPDRSLLRRGQTPQSFRLSTLKHAYEIAATDPEFKATDDCGVVLKYTPGVEVVAVDGTEENMKLTRQSDIHLLDKLFQVSDSVPPTLAPDVLTSELTGKVILVLEGSPGLGEKVAASAGAYGATALTFGRRSTEGHLDYRDELQAVARQVEDEHGQIDHVVSCGGALPQHALVTASDEEIRASTEVNYIAPVLVAQTFFGALSRSRGSLTFLTSSPYDGGHAGNALSSSARAAVVNLTQALAEEWADSPLRVNCISPQQSVARAQAAASGGDPAPSLLGTDDLGRVTLSVLASDQTGHSYDVCRDAWD